jgi:hypothetical protein
LTEVSDLSYSCYCICTVLLILGGYGSRRNRSSARG